MGIYLSQPNTIKESSDIVSAKFTSGCSSMQGWRSSQEDAHNMISEFDKDTSFFAVYDGHGGSEVAKFAALHLPEYLKNYQNNNLTMEKLLQNVFLSFDLTLKDSANRKELQKLSGQSDDESLDEKGTKENHLEVSGDAQISKIAKSKKIKTILFSPHLLSKKKNKLTNDDNDTNEIADKSCSLEDGANSSRDAGPSTSTGLNESSFFANESFITPKEAEKLREEAQIPINILAEKYTGETSSSSNCIAPLTTQTGGVPSLLSESTRYMLFCDPESEGLGDHQDSDDDDKDFALSPSTVESEDDDDDAEGGETNEEESASEKDDEKFGADISTISATSSNKSKKGSEKVAQVMDTITDDMSLVKQKREPIVTIPSQSNGHLQDYADDDKTPRDSNNISSPSKKIKLNHDFEVDPEKFEVKMNGHADSDESEFVKKENGEIVGGNVSEIKGEPDDSDKNCDNDLGDSDEGEEEEDDEEYESSLDEAEEAQRIIAKFAEGNMEKPAYDSGCTAVVGLLKGSTLYVANVGDSRCIVSCEGIAHDMSTDHKPEDKIERDRIEAAGGYVTEDGRVNEGLNLSRALGDHSYKEASELSAEKQMISPLPDVTELQLTSKHHFIVIACDGIWNSMSSQEVVDFVEERKVKYADKPSKICEELFDHCLAPDTSGDGTGCDNMTCIIVLLKEGSFSQEA